MELIIYILSSLIITSGLFIGLILCIISPEELGPGKKYFNITKHILFYLTIMLCLILFNANKVYMMMVLVILVLSFLKFKFKEPIIYLLLSVPFYISTSNESVFLVISSSLLLYTIFLSINLRIKYIKKNNWEIIKLLLLNYVWFFVGSILLYFTI